MATKRKLHIRVSDNGNGGYSDLEILEEAPALRPSFTMENPANMIFVHVRPGGAINAATAADAARKAAMQVWDDRRGGYMKNFYQQRNLD